MKVVIDESKWDRGRKFVDVTTGGAASAVYLLHPIHNRMCCLGFVCKAAGFTDDQIREVASPGNLSMFIDEVPEGIKGLVVIGAGRNIDNSIEASYLMGANDDPMDEEDRKRILTERFATIGIEVSFVPEVPEVPEVKG